MTENIVPIYTVILAAGMSSRLGFNKLLLKIDGEAVIRRAVSPFIHPRIAKVLVVTGNGQELIRQELAGLPVGFVDNNVYMQGMSTSVRAALPFLEGAQGVFFHLADKPFVSRAFIDAMIDAWLVQGSPVVVPVFQGKKGHPVLIDIRQYRSEMELLAGDRGLREIIEKHSTDVLCIDGDEGNIFDIDTVEEINLLRQRGYSVEKG